MAAGLIAFTALLAQIFGAVALYRLVRTPVIGASPTTAVSLLMISTGLMLERSDTGVMRAVTGRGPGNVLLLRLVPPAVIVPILVALISARLLEMPGIADVALVFALLTVVICLGNLFLLSATAIHLNKTHDEIIQAQARARALFEQASDGILIADLDGRYIDANDAIGGMLGYSRDEIIGATIMDMIMPEDLERLRATRERLLKGGRELGEWTLRHKNGTTIPTEITANILPDGRWQAFVRDISARKHAEEALRLSEEKFSRIVSTSADAIISIDADRRIILFNEGAEKIFGYSGAEMMGKPLDMLIPERLRGAHQQHVQSFAAGQSMARRVSERSSAVYGMRRNGDIFPADASISKLSVGGASILTVSLRDISEQKRAENELNFLAEFGSQLASTLDLEQTLTNIAQLIARDLADICIIDVIDEGGKMRRAHVACRDPAPVFIPSEIMDTESGERPLSPIAMSEVNQPLLVKEVGSGHLDSWFLGQNQVAAVQRIGPKSAMLAPLRAGGKDSGLLLLISSHSRAYEPHDLRFAEAIAQHAALSIQKALLYRTAMQATRARDEMLGIVAHDLRNPLQNISVNAQFLRQQKSGDVAETGVEIGNAVVRMNRLIQDLLDVTRIESGRLSLRPERIPVREFILELLDIQEALASSSDLEIRSEVPADLPEVWADRDRLNQIFENLLGNAIKFSRPGGQITLGARAEGTQVVFSVADSGEGIAETDIDHIFDRFWQAHKAKVQGAGLGLPIVRGLVEAHGGRVWVRSRPAEGSTFLFTIPMAVVDQPRSAHRNP
jgi:PAS domain S-box-containing protein